jgi:hypothetical protein
MSFPVRLFLLGIITKSLLKQIIKNRMKKNTVIQVTMGLFVVFMALAIWFSGRPSKNVVLNETQPAAPVTKHSRKGVNSAAEIFKKAMGYKDGEAPENARREDKGMDFMRNRLPDCVADDPVSAAKALETMPEGERRNEAVHIIAQTWAAIDSEAALIWARDLPRRLERGLAMQEVFSVMAKSDPISALRLAGETLNTPECVWPIIVEQWAKKDGQGALSWVNQQPKGELYNSMIQSILSVESQKDPYQAASLVSEAFESGAVTFDSVALVLREWSKTDLPAATAWVGQFPEGEFKKNGMRELNH